MQLPLQPVIRVHRPGVVLVHVALASWVSPHRILENRAGLAGIPGWVCWQPRRAAPASADYRRIVTAQFSNLPFQIFRLGFELLHFLGDAVNLLLDHTVKNSRIFLHELT